MEVKIKVPNEYCKNCPWLLKFDVCPFVRCVYRHGFLTDRKVKK